MMRRRRGNSERGLGRNSDGSAAGPLGKLLDLLATKETTT